MRALLLALASFLGGILLGAGSYRVGSALADLRAALPGPLAPAWLPRCANIYAGRCKLASDPHRGALAPPPPPPPPVPPPRSVASSARTRGDAQSGRSLAPLQAGHWRLWSMSVRCSPPSIPSPG